MVLESELRLEALDSFGVLTQAIAKLCDAILQDAALIAWVQESSYFSLPPTHCSARDKACAAFNQLQYMDNQAPREIIVVPGFIGASSPTLKLASEVNECKDRFKKSILALKSAKISPLDPMLTQKINSLLSRNNAAAQTLKSAGLARLHLKQCYRKIPILSRAPQKISWTWAHTRSIKKITHKKAQEMLEKKGSDIGIQLQMEKLNTISPYESLAIVQDLAPHLRANIVFTEEGKVQRKMIKGPLPILFPCQTQTPFPQFTPPTPKCDKDLNRMIRSDVRLDPVVFLPAIRAHRYA